MGTELPVGAPDGADAAPADALVFFGARAIVEKPFGADLASARALNRILSASFD